MVDTSSLISSSGFLFNVVLKVVKYNTKVKLSKVLPGERIITIEEVSWHDKPDDCWVVIYDRVYDITDFLDSHPGGSDILMEYAGRDASVAFRGTGHSLQAVNSISKYLIGDLPMEERIFRKPGGFFLTDMPV